MIRTIKLYGKLGKLFGKEWKLDVNSVAEAIRAIDSNTQNKFSQYLTSGEGAQKYYKIANKKKNNILFKEELRVFSNGDIYIMPAIKGSGKYGQIIIGAALIAISFYAGDWSNTLQKMGISMILGGIAQLLAPNPNAKSTDRNSYLFQGNSDTIFQGTSVGLVYGRALVPPMPVCMTVDNVDFSVYEGQKA